MYAKYWNLKETPFVNAYVPSQLYLSEQFEEGLARLFYLVSSARIAGVLTGYYGSGKSFLLSSLADRIAAANIPLMRFDAIPDGHLSLLKRILIGFGVKEPPSTLAEGLMTLQEMTLRPGLLKRHAVLIDEAQYLADENGLYLIHYLCNLRLSGANHRESPLVTIILAGAPELIDKIRAYQSLRARIQFVWQLDPLDKDQTIEFVQRKIMSAGGDQWIFTAEALAELHRLSGGLPRNITNICDTALMLGYAAGAPAIDPEIVRQAAIDAGVAAIASEEA